MYLHSVFKFVLEKYTLDATEIVLNSRTNNKYIWKTCENTLKKYTIPEQAVANKLQIYLMCPHIMRNIVKSCDNVKRTIPKAVQTLSLMYFHKELRVKD